MIVVTVPVILHGNGYMAGTMSVDMNARYIDILI